MISCVICILRLLIVYEDNIKIYHSLVIFKFNQKKLMRYVNMRYANMNI